MNNVALFAVGLLVTLLVAGAVSLLIWGALLDGRENDEWRAEVEHTEAPVVSPAVLAAES